MLRGRLIAPSAHKPLGIALTAACMGLLFAIGAQQGDPEEARLGRRLELLELIAVEQRRTERLEAGVIDVRARISAEEERLAVGMNELASLREDVERAALPAGFRSLTGPGVAVTLHDAIGAWDGSDDPNRYVVHEHHLQAVVNALFAGGADAVEVNGDRILASSAIICIGTTLRLNGRYHTPPYRIVAIGDPAALKASLESDPGVATLAATAERFGLTFAVDSAGFVEVAGMQGSDATVISAPADHGELRAR